MVVVAVIIRCKLQRNLNTPADRAWWVAVLDAAEQGEWIIRRMAQLEKESNTMADMEKDGAPTGARPMTLGEDYPVQLARARNLLMIYSKIGPVGMFGAKLIEDTIRRADAASVAGDVVAMVRCYQELKALE